MTDPKQPAYDAVYGYIRSLPDEGLNALPSSVVERNAVIWHAVHAALDAVGFEAAMQRTVEQLETAGTDAQKLQGAKPLVLPREAADLLHTALGSLLGETSTPGE